MMCESVQVDPCITWSVMWDWNMRSMIWFYVIQVCIVIYLPSEFIAWNPRHVSSTRYVYIRRVQTTKQKFVYITHKSYHTERWKSKRGNGKSWSWEWDRSQDFRIHGLDY